MDQLALTDFEPRVGSVFTVNPADGPVFELELISADRLPSSAPDDLPGGRPFSLMFRGPAKPTFPQGIIPLVHPEIGELELFLVPMQPDAEGPLYEAVFA